MYLAFGMVCALLESRILGRGQVQVVDAAIVDGVASLSAYNGAVGLLISMRVSHLSRKQEKRLSTHI